MRSAPRPALVALAAAAAAFAVALLLVGCAASPTATTLGGVATTAPGEVTTTTGVPATTSTAPPPTTRPTTTTSAPATTTALVDTLSPRQLAGQRVVYSYTGFTPPASLLASIRRGEAAGVIFFSDNIQSEQQLRGVIRTLERADDSSQNPVRAPLLLMTDQEGGRVRRLPGAPLLSAKEVGASAAPVAAAREAGSGAGRNLRGVGLNVNLAPVLDVYRRAGDFADRYGRSFGSDSAVVGRLGAEFISTQQDAGVAATAKHFPGLGAAGTSQDTDLGPVVLDVPLKTLRTVDESPYTEAIAAGVRLVMVSWATYPALDADLPAGLSPTVVQGELRERLGFAGVTITDALEAGALDEFGTLGHRAVLAAGAGMDLVLYAGRDVAQGDQVAAGLRGGYLDGSLDRAAFKAAAVRVIELRVGLGR